MTNKTPELRFKDFEGKWEERKLGEIASEITRNDPESNAPVMMITAENGFIFQSERYSFDNAGKSLKSYILLKRGELAYNHGASKLRPYGSCFALKVDEAKIPFVYHCFSVLDTDTEFLSIVLNGTNTSNQLRKIVSSGARMDGLLNISFADYCTVKIHLPSSSEQQQIGSFFNNLDKQIFLTQEKLEKTKSLKKTMLQKMFPKKGSKVPEIRLKGFEGEWEEKKLDNYIEVSLEKNTKEIFGKNEVLSVSGDYGVVNQIEFQGRSFAGASVSNYGVVQFGDIVYTKSPLRWQPYGIIKTNKGVPGIVSVLYGVYHPKEKVYPNFIQNYFESDIRLNEYLRVLVNKGAKNTLLISDVDALSGKVVFPCIDEQKAISIFFDNLSEMINKQTQKLDLLKQLKKSLLEKMFV